MCGLLLDYKADPLKELPWFLFFFVIVRNFDAYMIQKSVKSYLECFGMFQ